MPKLINLIGKKFGKLEVVGRSTILGTDETYMWDCRCDCGETKSCNGTALRSGCTKSCGCASSLIDNLVGQSFGFLLVKSLSTTRTPEQGCIWLCKCLCGNECAVTARNLVQKKTKSCGCKTLKLRSEKLCVKDRELSIYKTLYRQLNWRQRKRFGSLINFITFEDFCCILRKECYYCNMKPSNISKHVLLGEEDCIVFHSGVDRVDPSLGYLFNNCVPCCINCNVSKLDKTQEEFYRWVKTIYENLASRNLVK